VATWAEFERAGDRGSGRHDLRGHGPRPGLPAVASEL